MHPLSARIAPRRLTDELVTKPAKTKVRPKARMIGQAVGAGISIVSVRSSAFARASMLVLFSISASNDINDGEDDNPNCVHEVPIERQHVDALGILLLHRSEDCKNHHSGQA